MQLSRCACGAAIPTAPPQQTAFSSQRPRCSTQLPCAPPHPAQRQHRRRMRCRASGDSDSEGDGVDWEEKWSRFQAGIKDNIPKVEPGKRSAAPRPSGNSRQDQIRRQENAVLDAWNQESFFKFAGGAVVVLLLLLIISGPP